MSVEFDIARSGFQVRQAQSGDMQASRMLLRTIPSGSRVAVAQENRNQLVVGAAAIYPVARREPRVGPGVSIHVIPPCRRAGIGGELLEWMVRLAAADRYEALYSASRAQVGSSEHAAWQAFGFAPVQSVQEHRLPLDQFEPKLAPLVERMRKRGKIPENARLIPLYQAEAAEVVQVHLDILGGDRADLHRKARGEGDGAFHPKYSRVLLVGDEVIGFILAHRLDSKTAAVDADIVVPQYRGGWANIWLKLEATRGALSLGITEFQFTSFDHYDDTRSFTSKFGGFVTRQTDLMMKSIRAAETLPEHDV